MPRKTTPALLVAATMLTVAPAPKVATAPIQPSTARNRKSEIENRKSERPVIPFEIFFQDLRTQGTWVHLEDGRWAWRPDGVERDWRPFSRGTWVITDLQSPTGSLQSLIQNPKSEIVNLDWYWLSDEPWGWATSHYGRWEWRAPAIPNAQSAIENRKSQIENRKSGYWVWLPDGQWSPAWVSWRQGELGMGWHPMPDKPEFRLDKGTIGGEEAGFRTEAWTFVLWRDLGSALLPAAGASKRPDAANILDAIVVSSATVAPATPSLLSQTQNVTKIERREGVVHNPGPDRALVETKTARRLSPCRLMDTRQRRELLIVGRDETVLVAFRPVVKENAEEIQQFIARQAERYRSMKERRTPAK